MRIVLPGPARARVGTLKVHPEAVTVELLVRDPAQRDALVAVLADAGRGGFAVEIRILHEKGQPDGALARAERRRRKESGEKLTVREGGKSAVTEEP